MTKPTNITIRVFPFFWAWLFTIGLTHPGFWGGVLDLIIWPYELGSKVAQLAG